MSIKSYYTMQANNNQMFQHANIKKNMCKGMLVLMQWSKLWNLDGDPCSIIHVGYVYAAYFSTVRLKLKTFVRLSCLFLNYTWELRRWLLSSQANPILAWGWSCFDFTSIVVCDEGSLYTTKFSWSVLLPDFPSHTEVVSLISGLCSLHAKLTLTPE